MKDWTFSEIEYLKQNYREMKVNDIAKDLGRSIHSVYSMQSRLKKEGALDFCFEKNSGKKWGPEEIQKVKDLRRKGITCREIAEAIGRSQQAVKSKVQVAGL